MYNKISFIELSSGLQFVSLHLINAKDIRIILGLAHSSCFLIVRRIIRFPVFLCHIFISTVITFVIFVIMFVIVFVIFFVIFVTFFVIAFVIFFVIIAIIVIMFVSMFVSMFVITFVIF